MRSTRRLRRSRANTASLSERTLWLCASEDRGGGRFWKQEFLLESLTGDELAAGLESRLAEAHGILASWQPGDLEYATHLRRQAARMEMSTGTRSRRAGPLHHRAAAAGAQLAQSHEGRHHGADFDA